MKRYLWLVIGLFCLNANASIKDAFAQIEAEEGMLLENLSTPDPSNNEKQIVATPKKAKQEANEAKAKQEAMLAKQKARQKAKEAKAKQEAMLAKQKARQKAREAKAKQEAMLAKQKAKQEAMLAKQKAKQEAMLAKQKAKELEAYEKQRAQKLAETKKTKEKKAKKNSVANLSNKVDEIDLEQEAKDRQRAADEAYARAVEEMSQEY